MLSPIVAFQSSDSSMMMIVGFVILAIIAAWITIQILRRNRGEADQMTANAKRDTLMLNDLDALPAGRYLSGHPSLPRPYDYVYLKPSEEAFEIITYVEGQKTVLGKILYVELTGVQRYDLGERQMVTIASQSHGKDQETRFEISGNNAANIATRLCEEVELHIPEGQSTMLA